MSDALSIRAAAAEAGAAPAIITATRTLTFADCAAALVAPASSIVAEPSVATILAVHAALEARRPLALLHARAPVAELDRQRAALAAATLPPDAAIVLFTSGSTGPARGIVLSRAALIAAADASAAHLGWRDDDRWLLCLPLAHAGGLSIAIRCLAARRPLVLHEGDFDAGEVAVLAATSGATLASFVPTQLAALLDLSDDRLGGTRSGPDLSGDRLGGTRFRAVLLGGAASPPALLERAAAHGWPVLRTYGLTETFGQVATARTPDGAPVPLPGVAITAGSPGAPAPIAIRGPMLATRYLDGAPIGSRSPAGSPDRALVTADLGYLADGAIHVVGRADDVIITGGENVHPTQVESVLAATPGVRAACVFGLPDPRWGQVVGAAIATDSSFDRSCALARWHSELPAFARPRRLAIAALPLLPSGKIDRRAAAALPSAPLEY